MAGDSRSRSRSVSFREEATPTSYSKFAIDRVPATQIAATLIKVRASRLFALRLRSVCFSKGAVENRIGYN